MNKEKPISFDEFLEQDIFYDKYMDYLEEHNKEVEK